MINDIYGMIAIVCPSMNEGKVKEYRHIVFHGKYALVLKLRWAFTVVGIYTYSPRYTYFGEFQ